MSDEYLVEYDLAKINQASRIAGVYLTYRCDLDCPGCNSACFVKHPTIPDLTLPKFTSLLDQVESLGFRKHLEILGGEPTLHLRCLDFIRVAKARDFGVVIWSNNYGPLAKTVLAAIRPKRGKAGEINLVTQKPNGRWKDPPMRWTRTIYCSPADCGLQRLGCWWVRCGYSVNELGIAVCNIGGLLAHYTCPEVYTRNLADLLDPSWVERSYRMLCRHCGAFLDDDLRDRPEVSNVNGTLMTETWIKAFGL